jgi:DNA primase
MRVDADELAAEFDIEYWFDRESRPCKLTHGSSGEQINAKECPACGDQRWRTYLNKGTGFGNCFVCSKTFSKLGFVHAALGFAKDDRKGWAETFKHVRDCLAEQGWRPRKKVAVNVEYQQAVLPTSFELPTPEGQNLVYLETRGIDVDLCRYFHLRYCIRGKNEFIREDGSKGYQNFDGRVIIPVFDLDGKFVTYQGRDTTGLAGDKKYLFPAGLPGTGRYLLNGQSALRTRRVVMGEGAFDVMAIKKALDEDGELRNVVAVGSFGKHLSFGNTDGNDQLGRFRELRKSGLELVTIMWDGEPKALVAALDAAERLVGIGIAVKIAILPADKDPNEVLPEVVRTAYREATIYNKILSIRWRLHNPYQGA